MIIAEARSSDEGTGLKVVRASGTSGKRRPFGQALAAAAMNDPLFFLLA